MLLEVDYKVSTAYASPAPPTPLAVDLIFLYGH